MERSAPCSQDDLCARAARTDPICADRIEHPLLQSPGHALAGGAQLPAPAGAWKWCQAALKQ